MIENVGETPAARRRRGSPAVSDTTELSVEQPALLGPHQDRVRALIERALFGPSKEAPTIGRYRVLRPLGEGGCGVVYAAYAGRLS